MECYSIVSELLHYNSCDASVRYFLFDMTADQAIANFYMTVLHVTIDYITNAVLIKNRHAIGPCEFPYCIPNAKELHCEFGWYM